MRIIMAHNILKGFWYLAGLYLILKKSVSKGLEFGQKWQNLNCMPILSAYFVTIATVIFLKNAETLHVSHSSSKQIEKKL